MDLTKTLKSYCKNILNDKPLSCQKHKWACERFLSDFDRQGTKAFPYVFIPKKATRFIKWCALFKHTQGVLVGQSIDLYYTPILLFIFSNIYGWYHKDTGNRRFNKMYWQVARKNVKSQSLALVGSYELMAFDETGEKVNQIYCAATKTEQARVVFDETVIMMKRCKEIQPYYKYVNGRLQHITSDSFMRVLSEEDRKTGDGLNPQCGIIDEYHAHETSEILDIVASGQGALKEPLIAIISTAGFNLNHPCYTVEYQLISKILDPNIPFELDNYFVMVNELDRDENGELIDDIKDPAVWIKSNPIVASYPEGIKKLSDDMKEALEIPEKMRDFLTKRMNIWVHLTELTYISMLKWANCHVKALPDLKEQSVWIGIDFSSKIDLTSAAYEIKIEEDGIIKYVIKSHSWMARETFEMKCKTDKVPYGLWAEQGWITVQDGGIVDYIKAIEDIKQEIKDNNWFVECWCLDPWCAGQIMSTLSDEGEEVVEIRQGPRTLSEPTKDFRDMVLSGRILHDGNPVLAWAISNSIADKVDRNESIILNKNKSKGRIDPIAAVINAHVRCIAPLNTTGPDIAFI